MCSPTLEPPRNVLTTSIAAVAQGEPPLCSSTAVSSPRSTAAKTLQHNPVMRRAQQCLTVCLRGQHCPRALGNMLISSWMPIAPGAQAGSDGYHAWFPGLYSGASPSHCTKVRADGCLEGQRLWQSEDKVSRYMYKRMLLPDTVCAVIHADRLAMLATSCCNQPCSAAEAGNAIQCCRYPDYIMTDTGLQYKDLRDGSGDTASEGSHVTIDWDGYTLGYYGRPFEARNKVLCNSTCSCMLSQQCTTVCSCSHTVIVTASTIKLHNETEQQFWIDLAQR